MWNQVPLGQLWQDFLISMNISDLQLFLEMNVKSNVSHDSKGEKPS